VSEDPIAVSIHVLDKEYRIACGPAERQALLESARMLDERMREIRQSGRVIGSERIAVLAALNIAHELVEVRNAKAGVDDEQAWRLRRLQERIGDALGAEQPALDDSAQRV
jgi:cell division protein ZapA